MVIGYTYEDIGSAIIMQHDKHCFHYRHDLKLVVITVWHMMSVSVLYT